MQRKRWTRDGVYQLLKNFDVIIFVFKQNITRRGGAVRLASRLGCFAYV